MKNLFGSGYAKIDNLDKNVCGASHVEISITLNKNLLYPVALIFNTPGAEYVLYYVVL